MTKCSCSIENKNYRKFQDGGLFVVNDYNNINSLLKQRELFGNNVISYEEALQNLKNNLEQEINRVNNARKLVVENARKAVKDPKFRNEVFVTDLVKMGYTDPHYCSTRSCEIERKSGYTLPNDVVIRTIKGPEKYKKGDLLPIQPSTVEFAKNAHKLGFVRLNENEELQPGDRVFLSYSLNQDPQFVYHSMIRGENPNEFYYSNGDKDNFGKYKVNPRFKMAYRYVGNIPQLEKELNTIQFNREDEIKKIKSIDEELMEYYNNIKSLPTKKIMFIDSTNNNQVPLKKMTMVPNNSKIRKFQEGGMNIDWSYLNNPSSIYIEGWSDVFKTFEEAEIENKLKDLDPINANQNPYEVISDSLNRAKKLYNKRGQESNIYSDWGQKYLKGLVNSQNTLTELKKLKVPQDRLNLLKRNALLETGGNIFALMRGIEEENNRVKDTFTPQNTGRTGVRLYEYGGKIKNQNNMKYNYQFGGLIDLLNSLPKSTPIEALNKAKKMNIIYNGQERPAAVDVETKEILSMGPVLRDYNTEMQTLAQQAKIIDKNLNQQPMQKQMTNNAIKALRLVNGKPVYVLEDAKTHDIIEILGPADKELKGYQYQFGGSFLGNLLKPFNNSLYGISKLVNKTGYKSGATTENNPINIIPGNKITMQGVKYPVFGMGSNGLATMMYPGRNYNFGNSEYVIEKPIKYQTGGRTYEDKVLEILRNNNDGSLDPVNYGNNTLMMPQNPYRNNPDMSGNNQNNEDLMMGKPVSNYNMMESQEMETDPNLGDIVLVPENNMDLVSGNNQQLEYLLAGQPNSNYPSIEAQETESVVIPIINKDAELNTFYEVYVDDFDSKYDYAKDKYGNWHTKRKGTNTWIDLRELPKEKYNKAVGKLNKYANNKFSIKSDRLIKSPEDLIKYSMKINDIELGQNYKNYINDYDSKYDYVQYKDGSWYAKNKDTNKWFDLKKLPKEKYQKAKTKLDNYLKNKYLKDERIINSAQDLVKYNMNFGKY